MALEFLCSNEISMGRKIFVPEGANFYSIRSDVIRFFKVNPTPSKSMREIPSGTDSVSFEDYRKFACWTHYGEPSFYNKENVLNEGGV